MAKPNLNLNEVREFFNPLIGRGGAGIPLPASYQAAAKELSGKTMTLADARAQIKSLTKKTGGEISIHGDCIIMHYPRKWTLRTKVACHSWPIIWHRPVRTA